MQLFALQSNPSSTGSRDRGVSRQANSAQNRLRIEEWECRSHQPKSRSLEVGLCRSWRRGAGEHRDAGASVSMVPRISS
jgi:hypothetical protein